MSSPIQRPRGAAVLAVQRGSARARTLLRSTGWGLVLLSLLVGLTTGFGAIAFRWLIEILTWLFTGRSVYTMNPGAPNPLVPGLGRWFLLFTPVLAGLIYGPLVTRFADESRGTGVPEVMYAVARRGGKIRPRVSLVKSLASALTIGGGGSLGREGPIVHIGAALGSTIGQLTKLSESKLRLLVAAGSAGGIAATFNAPLAGVFFAMELILVDFTAHSFGMVVLSSVTASVVGRHYFGNEVFIALPTFQIHNLWEYLSFALLGIFAGVVSVAFIRIVDGTHKACDRWWKGPEWLRPAVGGLLIGLVLVAIPQMYGVGYPVLSASVHGAYTISFLLLLMVAKMFATALTLGVGGSGGVFAPSLFVGATYGAALGGVAELVFPDVASTVGTYALIGMGAVVAGTSRAPITAVVILFELTGQYTIILPLMVAIVLSTLISRRFSEVSIYTLKLRRRGIDLSQPEQLHPAAERIRIGDVMGKLPQQLSITVSPADAALRLARSAHGVLPVVSEQGAYVGIVKARIIAEVLSDTRTPKDLTTLIDTPPPLEASDSLDRAVAALEESGSGALPVLDVHKDHVIGWVTHSTVLTALGRLG